MPSLRPQKPSLLQSLLDILESVLDVLSFSISLHEKNNSRSENPPPDKAKDTAYGRKDATFSPLRVVVEAVMPAPSPTEEQKAKDAAEERRKQNTEIREGRKFIAECLLACITALLLLVNVWLVLTTRKANKLSSIAIQNAKENFITDQQPVIWITPKLPSFGLNKQLQWNFEYSNYGRSPALNVHLCAHPIIGSAAFGAAQATPPNNGLLQRATSECKCCAPNLSGIHNRPHRGGFDSAGYKCY